MAKRTVIARGFGIVGCVASVGLFGCFASVYLSATDGHIDGSGNVLGLDFMVFWSSGILTEQGHLLDLFERASFHALTEELFAHQLPVKPRIWTYPPPMLLVTVPFGWLPYLWALVAWSTIFMAAYLLATRMPALLAAPSTMANLFFGQTGFLVAALFFGALRLLGRRPFLAGALFGLIVVKPHLGVMIPVALLAARAWLAFAGAALTVVALALLSGLLFGWEAWRLWFLEVLSHQTSVIHMGIGGDIMLSVWQGVSHLGVPRAGAWVVQALGTTTAVVATWWAFSRLRRGLIAPLRAFSILLLATCMATPYVLSYDWTLVAPVAIWGFAEWSRKEWTRTGMGLADLAECLLWMVIWLLPMMWFAPVPAVPTMAAVAVPAALWLVVRDAIRDGGEYCCDR